MNQNILVSPTKECYNFGIDMICIAVPKITSRLRYTFDFVFSEYFGIEYKLVEGDMNFEGAEKPDLFYGDHKNSNTPFIHASKFLFEEGLNEIELSITGKGKTTKLFSNESPESLMDFDPFAATFYMISRYEEYVMEERDRYGRFEPKNSLAYGNFLEYAIVDRWLMLLKDKLMELFPQLNFKSHTFNFTPTFDIDNAFAFRLKGIIRGLGGLILDLIKFRMSDFLSRLKVWIIPGAKDPYDSFEYIRKIHNQKVSPIIFWLLGDYGMYDKNISPDRSKFQALIKSCSKFSEVGIHPSFASQNNDTIQVEIDRLESIVKLKTHKSRFHYLRLSLPDSYQRLINCGITEDYTMGYSEIPGFRAGISRPFPFYDLINEKQTNLRIYPFQLMDATFMYHLKISSGQSLEIMKIIIDEVKEVNGELITVFHNESLGTKKKWEGWRTTYEGMLDYIRNN